MMETFVCRGSYCGSKCEVIRNAYNVTPTHCLYGKPEDYCNWKIVDDINITADLPDWCKVGEWVWYAGHDDSGLAPQYFKIERLNVLVAASNAINEGVGIHFSYLRPARIRPWTFTNGEFSDCVGKVFCRYDGAYTKYRLCIGSEFEGLLFVEVGGENTATNGDIRLRRPSSMIKEGWTLIDGSPCGVLEHQNENGEWVE